MGGGNPGEWFLRVGESAQGERLPGEEGQAFAFADGEYVAGEAIGEAVAILHRDDSRDVLGAR